MRGMHAPRPLDQTKTYLRESSFREDDQQTSLDSGAPPKFRQHIVSGQEGTRLRLARVETGTGTDLSASTITDNDQLPTDFRHNISIKRGDISFVCWQKGVSEEKLHVDDVGEEVGRRRLWKPNTEWS